MRKGGRCFSSSSSSSSRKRNFTDATTNDTSSSPSHYSSHSNSSSLDLSIVSWNISGCEPSNASPSNWTIEESMERIKYEILSHEPHIIALQESPSSSWGKDTFRRKYTSMGTTLSHCHYVDLLIRNDLLISQNNANASADANADTKDKEQKQEEERAVKMCLNSSRLEDPAEYIPAVATKLKLTLPRIGSDTNTEATLCVGIASCHLAPFGSALDKQRRYHQFQNLVSKMTNHNQNSENQDENDEHDNEISCIIVAGDMNMRQAEDRNIEQSFGMTDAWKTMGSKKLQKFTWNSNENLYHSNGYGFTARFDRVYVKSLSSSVQGGDENGNEHDNDSTTTPKVHIEVKDFGLMGNDPILEREGGGGRGHCLSDHYGLVCKISIGK